MQRLVDVVYWIALTLWVSLAIAGGLAAMAIFPAARELPLSMQGFEPFVANEPQLGRQLVAGHLVERVFAVAEGPRMVCAALAGLALLAQLALVRKPMLPRSRLLALAVASIALLVGAFSSLPNFQAADRNYRATAAADGAASPAVEERKAEVDAAHALATRVSSTEVGALLLLVALSALAAGGAKARG
jgi:hypothetical protein